MENINTISISEIVLLELALEEMIYVLKNQHEASDESLHPARPYTQLLEKIYIWDKEIMLLNELSLKNINSQCQLNNKSNGK